MSGQLLREKRLRAEKERAQQYMDIAAFAFVALDAQGRITLVNRRGLEMLGYEAGELLGRDWFDACLPARIRDEVRGVFRQLMTGEVTRAEHVENPVLTRTGEERLIAWRNTVVGVAGGAVIGTLSSGEDITDRRRVEAERERLAAVTRERQRLASIGTLARGVAHEINNPINGVMNYAQLILDASPADGRPAEYARQIVRESERVAAVVRNLLSFARPGAQAASSADVHDIVESTLALMRAALRRDQIQLEVNSPEGAPKLRCRAQQIQQVLMNLLANACGALNERYPAYHPDKVLRVTASGFERQGRPWVRITVEDHGVGITAEIRDRVFDPFFTTKPREKAAGLGLSVGHGIVREHGGEISIESEPGRGTRVHVDLPVDSGGSAGQALA